MAATNRHVFRVGLTGGIASGKTTVARLFAALGVPIIDADEIARQVVEPGSEGLTQIVRRFGPSVRASDGSLNRQALRAIVFADPAARADLEALTHPVIRERLEARSAIAGGPYQMLVVPLLIEAGGTYAVDRKLVVDCDEELQIRRLQARDGSTREQARQMIAAQTSRASRLKVADDVITNDGDLAPLRTAVERLHLQYLRMAQQATP